MARQALSKDEMRGLEYFVLNVFSDVEKEPDRFSDGERDFGEKGLCWNFLNVINWRHYHTSLTLHDRLQKILDALEERGKIERTGEFSGYKGRKSWPYYKLTETGRARIEELRSNYCLSVWGQGLEINAYERK